MKTIHLIRKFIQKYSNVLLTVFFVMIVVITFHTYQQMFYVESFQIVSKPSFFDFLKNQSLRWLLWFFLAFVLFFTVRQDAHKEKKILLFLKHFLIVIFLVLFNITIISLLKSTYSPNGFNFEKITSEIFPFFFFQKSPVYVLGYIGFVVILFFHFERKELQIKVDELIKIKDYHEKEYEELKKENSNSSKILQIKVGNKIKMIPVEDIFWIEADDYCVIVHTSKKPSYVMRSSLKSLENKLPNHFLRVHRKGIVNMKKVKEVETKNHLALLMGNLDKVPVSKGNITKVKKYSELL